LSNRVDFLIIGQGIAGTCIGITLEKAGKSFHLVNSGSLQSSSSVAAGLMHPITGRRIVKSWLCDELFPFAQHFYRECEAATGQHFYHQMDCLEMVPTVKMLNDWMNRTADESIANYVEEDHDKSVEPFLQQHHGRFRIKQGGWLDLSVFNTCYRDQWIKRGIYFQKEFLVSDLSQEDEYLGYNGFEYQGIIFCEGWHAIESKLWNWLPFEPVKGEILTVRIPNFPDKDIIVNGIFIIPLGNDCFRVGSTYDRENIDCTMTPSALEELSNKLKQTITCPFEIIEHKAGVRPAAKDRKPVLGTHPENKRFHLFNGLGSKGSTLGPYFAQHLVSHLIQGTELMEVVDIKKYY